MAALMWAANPGIRFQAIIGNHDAQYLIMSPALGESQEALDGFRAMVIKRLPNGMVHTYDLDGAPFRRDNDAQSACQSDWDNYGLEIPADKLTP